jgi:aspartyl protease family protein
MQFRLTISDIVLKDINASINSSITGNEILLGMSALKEIEFTRKGDRLISRQYAL